MEVKFKLKRDNDIDELINKGKDMDKELHWLKDQLKSLRGQVEMLNLSIKLSNAENEQHKEWLRATLKYHEQLNKEASNENE